MQKTKTIVLGIASLILQTVTWWFIHKAFGYQASTMTWIWLAVLASLAISVSTFFFLTDKMRWYSEVIIGLSALSYLLVSTKNEFVLIGGLLFFAFTFWYQLRLAAESKSRLDFSVTRVVGGSVSLMIYGLLLLIGFNIYYNVQNSFANNPDQFYDKVGQQAAKSIPYFTKQLPNADNLNQPFSDYLENQAKTDPKYNSAGSFEKQVILNGIRSQFQQQFQIAPNANESLADIIAEFAASKIKQAAAPFEGYLPLIFTIIIIGLLYTFAFLIRWTIILISWGLFQILRVTGFFKLETVVVEVKKLIV